MTATANPVLQKSDSSAGPFTKTFMERADLVAWMADADLGKNAIEWKGGGDSRQDFQINKVLTTKVSWGRVTNKGYYTYGSLAPSESYADAEEAAQQYANRLAGANLLREKVQGAVADADTFKKICATHDGEIEFPHRRVVAFHSRACGGCGGGGSVYCGSCHGNKVHPCTSCDWQGRVACWCGSGQVKDHMGNWQYCGTCGGSARVRCGSCHGSRELMCWGCRGTGSVTCGGCDGHRGFTDEFYVHGATKVATEYVNLPLGAQFKPSWTEWLNAGFPGSVSVESSQKPVLKSSVTPFGESKDYWKSCKIQLTGNVTTGAVQGSLNGVAVAGVGLHLNDAKYSLGPFLDAIIAKKTAEALTSDSTPKSITQGVKKSKLLSELVDELAKSPSHTSALYRRFAGAVHGAFKPDSLQPLAEAYMSSKRHFSRTIWWKAWKSYLIKLLPLAFLYVFLNAPFRIKEALGAKGIGNDAMFWAVTLLGLLIAVPTGLAIRQVVTSLKKEMGDGATLSAPYNNGYFVLMSIAVMFLAVFGTSSTYVQGPKLEGMYLSQFGLWYTPTAAAASPKRAEGSQSSPSSPVTPDPTSAHLRGAGQTAAKPDPIRTPASEPKAGAPKQSASQKATNPNGLDAR